MCETVSLIALFPRLIISYSDSKLRDKTIVQLEIEISGFLVSPNEPSRE